MGFWQNVADAFGFVSPTSPYNVLKDVGSVLSMGLYNPKENRFGAENLIMTPVAEAVGSSIKDSFHSATDALDASQVLGQDFNEYLGSLFESEDVAAQKQAMANEAAAVSAYERSEQAADNALRRARELRRTAYQDAVDSLKAAGLNPVLAAQGGISGAAVTAPQAQAPSSSSSKADALNAADLLIAVAQLLGSSANLLGNFVTKKSASVFYRG